MIAQRPEAKSRLKCRSQNGLTWPSADAYDELFGSDFL